MSKQDEGIDQEESKFYHDERRMRLAQKSNIEPTEEQRAAVWRMWMRTSDDDNETVRDIARLLAEREAKLRDEYLTNTCEMSDNVVYYRNLAIVLGAKPQQMANEYDRKLCAEGIDPDDDGNGYHMSVADVIAGKEANFDEADTLRVRVAELTRTEAKLTAACQVANATNKRRADREAQHLADIKALRVHIVSTESGDHDHFDESMDFDGCPACESARILAATAHYDDAKAGAPASTEGGEG